MIVVIDDNVDTRGFAAELLELHFGGNVAVKAVGPEDWQDIDWAATSIAIVDLMMPVTDGLTILRWLAEHHPAVERIAWSAVAEVDPEVSKLAVVITKPGTKALTSTIDVMRANRPKQ